MRRADSGLPSSTAEKEEEYYQDQDETEPSRPDEPTASAAVATYGDAAGLCRSQQYCK